MEWNKLDYWKFDMKFSSVTSQSYDIIAITSWHHTSCHPNTHTQMNYSFSFMAFVDRGSGCQCKKIKTPLCEKLSPSSMQEGGRVAQQVHAAAPTIFRLFSLRVLPGVCFCLLSSWKRLRCLRSGLKLPFLFLRLWKTQSKRKINASWSNKKVNSFHGIYI